MGIQEFIIYMQVIKRRWKPIVGLFLGTMITLFVISTLAPRVFQATSRLQVIAPSPGAITLQGGFRTGGFRDELAYTQSNFVEILKSRVVARRTVNAVDTPYNALELQDHTVVDSGNFIEITVTADGPEEAANLANTLASQTLAYYGELLAQSSGASGEFIRLQLDLARQELDRAQNALMQFKIENKVGSLDSDISQQTSLIRSLNLSRDQALADSNITKANAYDVLIAQREQELQNLLNLSAQYQTLQTAVDQAMGTYDFLLSKEAEVRITENQISNVNFIQIIEPADPPNDSISTFSKSIFVLGAVLSLVLGVAVAFVWEYIETSDVSQIKNDKYVTQQQPINVN